MDTSTVTIHMISSLDGFIAKKDNDVSWLETHDSYEQGTILTEEDIEAFVKNIDCYVMGARTYEQTIELGWPYGTKPVIVVTHGNIKSERSNVKSYDGDLNMLINNQLKPLYQNIWMVGGSDLTKKFIRLKLVDEIVISIMPILLGNGKLFFDYIGEEHRLHLKDMTAYKDGIVELTYVVKK